MKKRIIFVLIIVAVVWSFISVTMYVGKKIELQQDVQRRKELYDKILDGISIKPANITIDFSKQISTGSPLIFGGAQYPDPQSDEVWNAVRDVGVTAMRTDFYIENMVPYNSSIQDYKNNKNDIQNPDTWNKDFIQSRQDAYSNAKKRGMKTMGIISYAPAWLTYSNTTRGIPKDWGVYEDIVKKSYAIYRDNLDYVEIWNEPTFTQVFLNVQGSGMSPTQAYDEIFYHAAKAIREVDSEKNDGKKILIGGPVSDNPNDTSMLEAIIQDPRTRQYIDFISYHNYSIEEPSWNAHKTVLAKYGMDHLPIFITEWNYDPKENQDSPYKTGSPAIIFTSNQLVEFLKMGLAGANYYSLLHTTDTGQNLEYLSFYKNVNGTIQLLPQARSWQILSKDLGLGSGKSNIYSPEKDVDGLNTIGFTNSSGQQGVTIVNTSSKLTSVNLHLTNLNKGNYGRLRVYYASGQNDARSPAYDGLIQEKSDGSLDIAFSIPSQTVLGVIFDQDKEWNFLNKILQ